MHMNITIFTVIRINNTDQHRPAHKNDRLTSHHCGNLPVSVRQILFANNSLTLSELSSGFPLVHWKKSTTFPGPPVRNFPGPFRSPGMLKYKEEHLLLITFHCRNCSM